MAPDQPKHRNAQGVTPADQDHSAVGRWSYGRDLTGSVQMPKKVAKNSGRSGRINLSSDELQRLGVEVGDDVQIDVAESKAVAKAIIDSRDADSFVLVSPASAAVETDEST